MQAVMKVMSACRAVQVSRGCGCAVALHAEMRPEAWRSCRYRWFGLAPRNLDWWGAISYTVGVGLYWIAAVSTMINDCPNSLMAPDVYVSRLTQKL